MRTILLAALALIAGVLLLVCPVQAQHDYYGYDDFDSSTRARWNVHAGYVWLNGETGDDNTWIIGFEYESPLGPYEGDYGIPRNFITFGVDYYPVDTLADNTESVVPVLLGYRKYAVLSDYRIFFGIGIGTRWASDDIPELEIEDGFEFEWGINAGVNFSQDLFGMVRYLAGTNASEDGLFSLEVGYRF